MAKVQIDQPLIPSVLDRLIDDRPDLTRETPRSRHQVLRDMKASLRRDLENLLNTRWRCNGWPEDLDELELSLVNYGLPDILGAELSPQRGREQFARVVKRVIEHFEPRLKSVKVEVLDNSQPLDRTLRLRIDALLQAEPAPEPVLFDTAVQPANGSIHVKGASR